MTDELIDSDLEKAVFIECIGCGTRTICLTNSETWREKLCDECFISRFKVWMSLDSFVEAHFERELCECNAYCDTCLSLGYCCGACREVLV